MKAMALAVVVLFAGGSSSGNELTISVQVAAPASAAAGKPIALVLRPIKRGNADTPLPVRREAVLGAAVDLDVPVGYWSLDVESAEYWHERQFFAVSGAATAVVARVWPAGELTGSVKTRDDSAPPTELLVRFQPSHDNSSLPGSEVRCPVSDSAFRCRLPAGSFDVRVRAESSITRFYWNRTVAPAAVTQLGDLLIERGSSIIGRIEFAKGVSAKGEQVAITATPANTIAADSGVAMKLLPLTATVESKGIFHIDGVAPGQYKVVAAIGNRYSSVPVELLIRPAMTAELTSPLRLDRPAHLRVVIAPPLDGDGKPWSIRVMHRTTAQRGEIVADVFAEANGEWVSTALHGGTYDVSVGPGGGGRWSLQSVTLVSEDMTLPITLSSRRVRGHITFGDKPLHAELAFGNASADAVRFTSDSDGGFAGDLPDSKSATWNVEISGETPVVRRTLHEVHVGASPDGITDIELKLPLTAVMGTVEDKDGVPVARTIVNLTRMNDDGSDQGLKQARGADDGSFQIAGMAPGRYSVTAYDYMRESQAVEFDVADDDDPKPLRLILQDQQTVRGRVVSEYGPVPGAAIFITPTDVSANFCPVFWTDARGEFVSIVSPGAHEIDVTVMPPGFAMRLFHTRIEPGKALDVKVGQNGGTIVIPDHDPKWFPLLIHAGATQGADLLVGSWPLEVAEGENGWQRLTAHALEPGVYGLCIVPLEQVAAVRGGVRPPDRCREGFLPAFGSLTLE